MYNEIKFPHATVEVVLLYGVETWIIGELQEIGELHLWLMHLTIVENIEYQLEAILLQ